MLRFKSFLRENRELAQTFEKMESISHLIKSSRYRELFLESIQNLKMAAENEEIYKARFSEYKGRVMRGIEYAYENLFETKVKDVVIKTEHDTSDLWGLSTAAEIKKLDKLYQKMNLGISEVDDFFNAIRDYPDAIKTIQSYMKSGKPPKPQDPNKFVKPMPSREALKLAKTVAEKAIDSFEKELRKNMNDSHFEVFEELKDITDPNELPKGSLEQSVAGIIFMVRGYGRNKTLELKPNSKQTLQKTVDNTADDIINQFVGKTSKKLSNVFEKKAEVKNYRILKNNVNNNLIENELKVEFADGSEFILDSKVIYKYSKTGKLFIQFPSRFTSVKLSDGSRMRAPSEEKMIKEF